MKKIVHISDLHLCNNHKKLNITRTENLLHILKLKETDHLIISGDISNDADPRDFIIFRELLQKYDFYDTTKTSVVIGNHDIFGGVHLASDIINFPRKCKETRYEEKIQIFYNAFKELFKNTITPNPNSPFPYVKDLDDAVLFGIDTNMAYSYLRNPLASNGNVNNTQFKHLDSLLRNTLWAGKKRIVVSHHHYYRNSGENEHIGFFLWNMIERLTIRLYNKKRMVRLFAKNKIDMVLHGHIHANNLFEKNGITFANGGGIMEIDFKSGVSKINIISLDNDGFRIAIENVQLEESKKKPFILYKELKPSFVA